MFQFQIGAIRGYGTPAALISLESFNSKLVRLEVDCPGCNPSGLIPFQFQIGAIRGKKEIKSISSTPSFNSKLVRLEVVNDVINIKVVRVSIPNWCD